MDIQEEWAPRSAPIDPEVSALIVRCGTENPRWGYQRVRGELLKLGIRVSTTTIRTILLRHGLDPAPRRAGPTWTEFLRSQASGILACDLFTVETIRLKTLYVVSHHTEQRPHRGLDLATPRDGSSSPARQTERRRIDRRDVLGGLIHECRWAA